MRRPALVLLLLAAIFGAVWLLQPPPADLVVYCAHDSVYSGPFLRKFTEDTGITVAVKFDTEATKSLGLTELIERERDHPRCDVFWNNEPLGLVRLARRGLLTPYVGPGHARIPEAFRDPGGSWVGFAARLRVWIVHAPSMQGTPEAIAAALSRDSLAGVALANPLYGTTRYHATAHWDQAGPAATRAWLGDLRRRSVRIVNGNATVKDLVAAGDCALGLTDTDDYFLAKDSGRPVAMVPATLADGRTVCVPNAVGIVRGCGNLPAARRLVDYLISAESELALARSRSRQVPLGAVDPAEVPAEVRALMPAMRRGYVFRDRAGSSRACLDWLKAEFAR